MSNSHAETWLMPDDATLGDLIVRAVEKFYLASVAGRVAWTLEDSAGRLFAVMEVDGVPGPPRVTVQSLWWAGLPRQIRDDGKANDAGEYAFFFRYHSGGRRLAWDAFRPALDRWGSFSGTRNIQAGLLTSVSWRPRSPVIDVR